jgi:tRNA (guanine37-N1)-methyltransferase
MRFDIFTLFPEVFGPYLETSILQRAIQHGLVEIYLHNIRDWTTDRHHITDDEPYGGGGGMVMKPEPIFSAVESVLGIPPVCPLILLSPQGRLFTHLVAQQLAEKVRTFNQENIPSQERTLAHPASRLGLLCGRYEGVDERVRQYLVTDQISIGDYVVSGGELPALVVVDALTRLIPGALGDPDGAADDSHASGLLEYPHFTRPPEFRSWRVPDVLISGDHARIARWRHEQSLRRTWKQRPDMLETAPLSEADRKFLASLEDEESGDEKVDGV